MPAFAILLAALAVGAAPDAAVLEATLERQRPALRTALAVAERGPPGAWRRLAAGLEAHPLFGYLEYAELARRLEGASRSEIEAFLADRSELPVAQELRRRFVAVLARRGDAAGVLALGAGLEDRESECHRLAARIALGEDGDGLRAELDRLWLSPASLPKACDPALAHYRDRGWRSPERIAERLRLAAAAGERGLVAHLAGLLPAGEREAAALVAEALADPAGLLARAQSFADRPWPRLAVLAATRTLARRDPAAAEAALDRLEGRLALEPGALAEARAAIAFHSALRFDPDAEARLARVPAAALGPELRRVALRAALARGDLAAAGRHLGALGEEARREPALRYLAARLAELAGREAEAALGYRALAGEAHWHGFLAAARLGEPPALCPRKAPSRAAGRRLLRERVGLLRALELHRLGRRGWAEAEWARAIADLGPEQRAAAARLAAAEGWHPAAIRALAAPETLGYYRLRFPLAHRRAVERAARRAGLEPALLFALARAESAFDPEAVSRAGARGLVQLLPATAEATARALGGTAGTWTRPERNLELGAWYLKSLLERHRGELPLALAAYNAGPGAVARWLARGRIGAHPDLWLETLPYRETREYVPRVLAFAMLYEWRLGGRMRPALAWLEGGAADVTLAPRCPEPSEAAR